METIRLTEENIGEAVERAAAVLSAGGIILYPTDTLYGLGGDAFSDAAFQKICSIKGRDERRPIHAVFSDLSAVGQCAIMTPLGEKLARAFLPGPLTLVFEKKVELKTGIAHNLSTIGVRIPKNRFCLALAQAFGKPYTTTSANVSNEKPLATVQEILAQLEDRAHEVDLVIDAGPLSPEMRSTVVDVRGESPFIIRQGWIQSQEIERAASSR
jgi:L-threonylcarbamoyladenylate synthase